MKKSSIKVQCSMCDIEDSDGYVMLSIHQNVCDEMKKISIGTIISLEDNFDSDLVCNDCVTRMKLNSENENATRLISINHEYRRPAGV